MSRHRFGLGNICTRCGTRFRSSAAAGPCPFMRLIPKYGRITMSILGGIPVLREYDGNGALVKETRCPPIVVWPQ